MNTSYIVAQIGHRILDQALALSQAAENSQYDLCLRMFEELASQLTRLRQVISEEQELRRQQVERVWPTQPEPSSRQPTQQEPISQQPTQQEPSSRQQTGQKEGVRQRS
jgi:hypothetical protein